MEKQILQGKTAIITGAASGIALRTSRLFASEGAKVIMLDMSPKGEERAEELRNEGLWARFKTCDISDPESAKEAVDFAKNEAGKIDILINVAGIANRAGVAEETIEEINHVIDVNLKGTMFMMKYVIPYMKENGGGSIVNIGSLSAVLHRSSDAGAAYSASKGGVNVLTSSEAIKYAKYGIRINSIQPGPTLTPMNEEVYKHWMPRVPLRRLGRPEDMAYTALFLASDYSSFITAASIPVTGGAHMAQAPSKKVD
jgi:NAD(P)-dependent dehydrogenase (short-subunit alcohol dehydrogenase family)